MLNAQQVIIIGLYLFIVNKFKYKEVINEIEEIGKQS